MKAEFALLLCALSLVGCVGMRHRQISGRLVQPVSRASIPGQQLDLDRPPGNYTGNPIALFGTPPPVAIASTTTDEHGEFKFQTLKDRGRFLTILLAGRTPADFRSPGGYAVEDLHDNLSSGAPQVNFDGHLVHQPGGGFRSLR